MRTILIQNFPNLQKSVISTKIDCFTCFRMRKINYTNKIGGKFADHDLVISLRCSDHAADGVRGWKIEKIREGGKGLEGTLTENSRQGRLVKIGNRRLGRNNNLIYKTVI